MKNCLHNTCLLVVVRQALHKRSLELVNMLHLQHVLHRRYAVLLAQLLFACLQENIIHHCQARCWQRVLQA
jgi:hypothetical protein